MKLRNAGFANPLVATLPRLGVCIAVSNPSSTDHPLVIISCHANSNKNHLIYYCLLTILTCQHKSIISANRRPQRYAILERLEITIDQPTAEKLVHVFVTCRIDFCNSLRFGLSKNELDKLQRILNAAARITKTRKFQNISLVLCKQHWLPVTKRIQFKILTITNKALNGMAPSYICDLLQVHHPNRNLRHGSAFRDLSLVVHVFTRACARCSLFRLILCCYTKSLEFLASRH